MTGLCILLLPGCAAKTIWTTSLPFGPLEISGIVTEIRNQESRVQTFFSTGRLNVKTGDSGYDYGILLVGTRKPITIRIEIFHSWGGPLLNILVNENGVRALSFPEKRFYTGKPEVFNLPELFHGTLDFAQLWGLVRGYPTLLKHARAISPRGDQIDFINERGQTVQVMRFDKKAKLPRLISFPAQDTKILFSDFQNKDGIYYAKKIRLDYLVSQSELTFNLKQTVLNQPIPEAVFELKKPEGFKTVPIKKERKGS